MVKVWMVRAGDNPTSGQEHYEISLADSVNLLDLKKENFLTTLDRTPKFEPTSDIAEYSGYRHVVIQIDAQEAEKEKWRSGFYLCSMSPREISDKLGSTSDNRGC
jgi:hypothetical protein